MKKKVESRRRSRKTRNGMKKTRKMKTGGKRRRQKVEERQGMI